MTVSVWIIVEQSGSGDARYMARETVINPNGTVFANYRQFIKSSIEEMHTIMRAMQLVQTLDREGCPPKNRPEIIEVWL